MKLFLSFATTLILVPLAMASTSTCPTTTLNQYLVPNFSCVSGNLLFSSFNYSPAGSQIMDPSNIHVVPLLTTADEGFQFTASWSVATGSIDSTIFFTVSTVDHSASIDDLFLSFNGTRTGTGIASVTEQWCANNSIPNCPIGSLNQIFVSTPGTPSNATAVFTPVTSISISKDISVNAGTNGTATITTVTNNFSQVGVPEPATCLMFGGGLLAIGVIRKRVRRQ